MEKTVVFFKKHPIAKFVYGISAVLFMAALLVIAYDFVVMPFMAVNYAQYATSLSHKIMLQVIGPIMWILKISMWLSCVLLWYYTGTNYCKKHRVALRCFAVIISVIPGMYIIGMLHMVPIDYDPIVGYALALIVGVTYVYVTSVIIKRPGNYLLAVQ